MKLACAVQRSRFMWNEARMTRYGNVINDAEMYVPTYISLNEHPLVTGITWL